MAEKVEMNSEHTPGVTREVLQRTLSRDLYSQPGCVEDELPDLQGVGRGVMSFIFRDDGTLETTITEE